MDRNILAIAIALTEFACEDTLLLPGFIDPRADACPLVDELMKFIPVPSDFGMRL